MAAWKHDDLNASTNGCNIALLLTPDLEQDRGVEKGPHAICFRTPAADVKPPPGIDVLFMRSVTFSLNIQWSCNASKRARPSNHQTLRKIAPVTNARDPDDEQLLWDRPLSSRLYDVDPDSGYNSLLSSQDDQDEDMMITEENRIGENETDEEMLLDVGSHAAIIHETDFLYSDSRSEASEGLLLDNEPATENFRHSLEGIEDNSSIFDDGEDVLYDCDDWFDDEDSASTFDPPDWDLFEQFGSFDVIGRAERTFFEHDMQSTGQHPQDHQQNTLPIRTKKRTMSSAFSDINGSPNDEVSNSLDLPNLLIAAIKVAMCGKLGRPGVGIKVTSNTMLKKLQHIAPAVWTPRYQEAIATRAALIPTIGHALFKSLQKNAVSADLKEAFGKIGDCHEKALWEVVKRGLDGEKKL